jgi:hypothetical protein
MVAAAALEEHGKEEEGGDEAVALLGGMNVDTLYYRCFYRTSHNRCWLIFLTALRPFSGVVGIKILCNVMTKSL